MVYRYKIKIVRKIIGNRAVPKSKGYRAWAFPK
jgi:hypothetical protein